MLLCVVVCCCVLLIVGCVGCVCCVCCVLCVLCWQRDFVIAGPCFRDPLAPEELTMKHVRAVPGVLVPQFLDEALQTHLISRSILANPPLRKQRNKSFETRKRTKNGERQFCVFLAIHPSRSTHEFTAKMSIHHEVFQPTPCNPSITKYSRIYGQDVHPSRSLSTHALQSIHHEVLTNFRPRCPSITKSFNPRHDGANS